MNSVRNSVVHVEFRKGTVQEEDHSRSRRSRSSAEEGEKRPQSRPHSIDITNNDIRVSIRDKGHGGDVAEEHVVFPSPPDVHIEQGIGHEKRESGGNGKEEEENEEMGGDEDKPKESEGSIKEVKGKEKEEELAVVKPIVWVRMAPVPVDKSVYQIRDDNRTLRIAIQPKPKERKPRIREGQPVFLNFQSELIFLDKTQNEVYHTTVKDLVLNAMEGVSGVFVCLGPEESGKSYTLFGSSTTYRARGILSRAVEDIFASVVEKGEEKFHIILSMFEIRRDKIKDLITLGPQDITKIGNFGPKGLFFEEVLSVDHALGLIFRGHMGQKKMHEEDGAKYHTIIYIDILCNTDPGGCDPWRSRITFAEIAAMPLKESIESAHNGTTRPNNSSPLIRQAPATCGSIQQGTACSSQQRGGLRLCAGPLPELQELIGIRRDIYYVEQMLTKTYDMRRMNKYYTELQRLGIQLPYPPVFSNAGLCFRQSKLAHCLKDVVSGTALVHILLHIRPENKYLHNTLELMRFAKRARSLKCGVCKRPDPVECMDEKRDETVQATEETAPNANLETEAMNEKMKEAFQMAMNFFEENVQKLEPSCRKKLKGLCENFKDMWMGMLAGEIGGKDEEHLDAVVVESHKLVKDIRKSEAEGVHHDEIETSISQTTESVMSESVQDGSKAEDQKGRKRGKKAKTETDRNKLEESAKNGVEAKASPADFKISNPPSVTEHPAHTELSISVVPAEAISFSTAHNLLANLHFKCKCWEEFSSDDTGAPMVQELSEKELLLRQYISQHNETLKEVVATLTRLVALELDLDKMEHESALREQAARKLEAASRCEKELHKLQMHQQNIQAIMGLVEASKRRCEVAFTHFTGDNKAQPCSSSTAVKERHKRDSSAANGTLEKRYEDLWTAAADQAQDAIKQAYPKRPPWTMFY